MWGVRDHVSPREYGHRVLGERHAIPAMLDLFDRSSIHATWAALGFAMCDGRDELLHRAPAERPTYVDPSLSCYAYVNETGKSEREDQLYYGPSLVRQIMACPNQEIATHSFSHFYCLETGQTNAQFRADLQAAINQLRDWNVEAHSIVFPRNQYGERHVEICAEEGLTAFRGNEDKWMYRPSNGSDQSLPRRAARLTDTYVPLTGGNTAQPEIYGGLINIPSSRFLRPHNPRLQLLDRLRLHRITSAMTAAAKTGSVFHLWWHPHNFGADLAENMAFLTGIIQAFHRLKGEFGMSSVTMAQLAAQHAKHEAAAGLTASSAKNKRPAVAYG